jgi:hypothetical protein
MLADIVELPAASYALAANVCEPLVAPALFHDTLKGAVVAVPTKTVPSQ